jgi:DNA-directed RNA polymerase subunit beta'
MAIHIPLTLKSQAEAKTLIISSNQCLSPATGEPLNTPSQDMILGYYTMTSEKISLNYIIEKVMCFKLLKKKYMNSF